MKLGFLVKFWLVNDAFISQNCDLFINKYEQFILKTNVSPYKSFEKHFYYLGFQQVNNVKISTHT